MKRQKSMRPPLKSPCQQRRQLVMSVGKILAMSPGMTRAVPCSLQQSEAESFG